MLMNSRFSRVALAAWIAAPATFAAAPQSASLVATGPDVIVGDVSGISSWGSVGGVSSFSLGTTSCNVGDAELNWISGTNDHPVIAQNIYRIENGVLEQVGQSWLKHGFAALQGSLCGSCTPSGSGSRLGVGCSDPYGSGLNGSQGRLGPRFEVNPFTGVFAYPHFAQGMTGNDTYKRIQVANADIDTSLHPGAQFIGEAQYVAKDDAAAGNGDNNVSWRPLNVTGQSGGAWQMQTTSSTRREETALHAWQEYVPTVQVVVVATPGDGRFVVGSHATDNGDGTWHYEYAVFNMTSERCAGSFSVPIAAGVTLSNIDFHDVDYHSGEPFDGTDWIGTFGGASVDWSTEDFAVNANANAIRWGTTYNFRFDASSEPADGVATIGLFKPGGQSSVTVDVCVPSLDDGSGAQAYCQTSPNSISSGARMFSFGSLSLSSNTFELISDFGIPGGSGLFYYGPNQIQTSFGDGFRCVGGQTFRLNPVVQADAFGTATLPVDFTQPPTGSGAGLITPGSTWNFQHWYRDVMAGMSGFNLSDGLSVTFAP